MITPQNAGKNNFINFIKRVRNIQYFASLDLTHNLNVYTKGKEKLFIQQTKADYAWDFIPILKVNGIQVKNLTFEEIWDVLMDISIHHKKLSNTDIQLLAHLLYDITYYSCHKKTNTRMLFANSSLQPKEREVYIFDKRMIRNPKILKIIKKKVPLPTITGGTVDVSIESFLVYNDILASNEDCKYFYLNSMDTKKNTNPKHSKNPDDILKYREYKDLKMNIYWNPAIGRINNLLTHINILALTLGIQRFSTVLNTASQLRGVAPIDNATLKKL